MIKECLDYEKDFNSDRKVYDIGVHDSFDEKFYIVKNIVLNSIRFMAKDKEFKRSRKYLDDRDLKYVIIPKWLDVINVTEETYKTIQNNFPDSKLPCRELLQIDE